MKIFNILLIMFIMNFYDMTAEKVDSEVQLIYNNLIQKNDEKSVDSLYNTIIGNIDKIDRKLVWEYFSNAKNSQSNKVEYYGYEAIGKYYFNHNKLDSAILFYDKYLNLKRKNHNYNSNIKLETAIYLIKENNFEKATKYLMEIIEIEGDSTTNAIGAYAQLGNVYRLNKMYDKSEQYLKKASQIADKIGEKKRANDLLLNLIAVYASRGDLKKAKSESFKAITRLKKQKDSVRLGDAIQNLGYIYFNEGNLEEALHSWQEALEIERKNENSVEDIVGLLINISAAYTNLNQVEKSAATLEEIIKMGKQPYHLNYVYKSLEINYFNLLQKYLHENNIPKSIEAFDKLDKYTTSLDSLQSIKHDEDMKHAIADATAKYETEKMEAEKSLEKEKRILAELKKDKAEQTTLYLTIFLLVVVLLTVLLFIQNNNRKVLYSKLLKKDQELALVNKDLFDKIDKLIKSVAFKDKLLSVISHDLQTPVQSIKLLSEKIKMKAEEYSKKQLLESNDILNEISEELSMLLNNLLTWIKSQGETIQVEKSNFNIKEITDDIINLYQKTAEEKNIILKNNIVDDSLVFADRNMIATVIRNLLSNSIKFSKKNATVSINSEEKDNSLKICIKDQSDGIPNEKLDKIFNLDKKDLSPESNGLGLKISKEFVEMNGGEIYAKSEVGIGSEFGFVI